MNEQYLPRLINMDNNENIPLVGISGTVAMTSYFEDVPMTVAYIEASETYGWERLAHD